MKKFRGTITFCIIFAVILVLDFVLYKNIDIVLPEPKKQFYSFEKDLHGEQVDFLLEIERQVEMQANYRYINEQELDNIIKNEVLYSIIKNDNTLYNIDKEELRILLTDYLYKSELHNTIYGDLKILSYMNGYDEEVFKDTNILILYSDDMKKICYLNVGCVTTFINTNIINPIYEVSILEKEKMQEAGPYEDNLQYDKKSKTELIDNCKEKFLNLINKYEFNPDTIINKENYYILEDSENDVTVYYSSEEDIIFGFYIGFEI